MCAPEQKNIESFDENIPLESFNGSHLNNLLDLSSDMKYLLQSTLMSDIALRMNGKYEMYCHRDILKFRSKWFYNAVCEADAKGVDVIEVDEDPRVVEAILCYIYTGDLRLLEYLNVCLVEVYEASIKYGFSRLGKILERMLQESDYHEEMKFKQFQWLVKVGDVTFLDVECPALTDFSICGNDKWQLKVKYAASSDDSESNIVVYLLRQTEKPRSTIHKVQLNIYVTDCIGKRRHSLSDKHDFLVDGEYVLSKSIPLSKLMDKFDNLLSDGILTLTCELTFLARVGFLKKFRLPGTYRKYISNELVHLSEDMFDVYRDGKTHDICFSRCHVKIHYYILLIRSRIPKDFIQNLEKRSDFGKRLWTSFATFLYTGQSRFLDEHARAIYCALSETVLTMAKAKYSNFLARNLTLETAFYIMNDAITYKDNSLTLAAANFLASKSETELEPQAWIRIAIDKEYFLKLVPQLLAFKQFL